MNDSKILPVNPITLHFHRDQRHIEKKYRSFSFNNNLKHIRICYLVAILLYAMLAFFDLQIAPENASIFMTIRFAVVCPIFSVGFVLTYLPWYKRISNYMHGFYVLLTAGGCIAMGFFAPEDFHFVYFLGFLICLIFGYTFIHLPFLFASASGWIAGTAYCLVQFNYGEQNGMVLIHYTAFLLSFEFLLMIICYTAERANRNSFYLFHLLAIERDKRGEINAELADSLNRIKKLSGLLPICASCKKIRDDKGYWNQIESYIRDHSEAEFSHSICPIVQKSYTPI